MRKTQVYILLALLFPMALVLFLYPTMRYCWSRNDRYQIATILQKKPPIDSLKCAFIAETLGLTSEQVNLYRFDLKVAEEKLLQTHVIKEVSLKKLKPHTLFVDYKLRKPMAYLADRSNTALDEEGMLFPFAPFYTPKHLPEIYLGDTFSANVWGKKINEKKLKLAKVILETFPPHTITWIDLSHIETASLGQKEVVVEYKSYLLRLSPKDLAQAIKHFFLLEDKFQKAENGLQEKKKCLVDLRLPQVAFYKYIGLNFD